MLRYCETPYRCDVKVPSLPGWRAYSACLSASETKSVVIDEIETFYGEKITIYRQPGDGGVGLDHFNPPEPSIEVPDVMDVSISIFSLIKKDFADIAQFAFIACANYCRDNLLRSPISSRSAFTGMSLASCARSETMRPPAGCGCESCSKSPG